jgi:hypothetical protein
MRENLQALRKGAARATLEQRKEAFTVLMVNLMGDENPWDKETYGEITATIAHLAQFDKVK